MKDHGKSSAPHRPGKAAERSRDTARLEGDLRTIAYRLSHDLQTPLGGIIFSAEVLKQSLPENDPASRELTASILRSVDELSQLVRRASFVIKASINDSPAGMVRMRQPVSRALEALEGKILGQGAVITSPSDWPEVTGVSTWLETIWWNLVANAVEHAGTAPRIELGWDEQAGEIRFWVSDNGPGVPAARRNKLFHKFETLHEMDSSRGMGLSIVQRLVDLQGGHCGYEPNPGGGARFFFVLPV